MAMGSANGCTRDLFDLAPSAEMIEIAGLKIGPDHPCRIVAEIGTSHNGSKALALRLIREATEAGADLIKFQCYTPDEMVALRGDGPAPPPWDSYGTLRQLYERAQTPHAWFPELVSECERVGVPWFSSVFGTESIDLLESLECPAYKVAAPDISAFHIWELVFCFKPIIASSRTGKRIRWADLTLYCPPGYPQDSIDCVWWDYDGDGLSYHGTDVHVPSTVAQEASLVEVHVQLDDIPSELDAHSSLTVSQLRKLCEAVRR
jgi:sialic acid synthase SpsE